MRRVVVLGTGTGVGKTFFTAALARALSGSAGGPLVQAVKPIETGIPRLSSDGSPPVGSDAAALETASTAPPLRPHPLWAFPRPVSPHLEARRTRRPLRPAEARRWLSRTALHDTTRHGMSFQLVETAGGVFSPLSARLVNLDLALALDPAIWILVASDSLGVLHDVRATLLALERRARLPDHLVLSGARAPDASTGTNARELARLGLPKPAAVLARGVPPVAALRSLVRTLIAR